MPKRIQRKRTNGWKMPPNAVYVGRPTKWGNPWAIGKVGPLGKIAPDAKGAVGLFKDMLSDPELRKLVGYPKSLEELRGKDLACFCPLDQPCHADVLLEIANA